LETGLYNITENRQAYDNETSWPYTYRTTAEDMAILNNFQKQYRATMLPPASNFTIELAFNGRGYYGKNNGQPGTNVNQWVLQNRDEFLWLTHTWNHIDMYVWGIPPARYRHAVP
jgi:hypothetical protein